MPIQKLLKKGYFSGRRNTLCPSDSPARCGDLHFCLLPITAPVQRTSAAYSNTMGLAEHVDIMDMNMNVSIRIISHFSRTRSWTCEDSQAFWPPPALFGDGLGEGHRWCCHASRATAFRSSLTPPLIGCGMSGWLWQDRNVGPKTLSATPFYKAWSIWGRDP
jgi:hypothetical protein